MPIQLEFNLDQKAPVDHLYDVWAKTQTSNQRQFRRLFAENSAIKKRLKAIEDYIELQSSAKCEFYEFDLFTYQEKAQ